MPNEAAPPELRAALPLLRELGDLKRVRVAGRPGSACERLFARAWAGIAAGALPAAVAERETAAAVAAARLAGFDAEFLREEGVADDAAVGVLRRGFAQVAAPLDAALRGRLDAALAAVVRGPAAAGDAPDFVQRLIDQPRAGATHPGRPRVVLLPTESHGDHCGMVAVYAALLAPFFGADPALPFLAGLAHHLHNGWLPDAGFAGDELLGAELAPLAGRLTTRALGQLAPAVRAEVERALALVPRVDLPEARAFHAADVLDRVLEMEWHARTAAFTLDHALGELEIVHAGHTQRFEQGVVRAAGLA